MSNALPPALARRAHAIARSLAQHPARAGVTATVVIGADDPLVLGSSIHGPLVVAPALGRLSPGPAERALAAAASVVVLLDAHDSTCVPVDRSVPVVWAGLPEPVDTPPAIHHPPSTSAFARAWDEVGRGRVNDSAAWVDGAGAALLAAAMDGWGGGRAVIALPRSSRHPALVEGGAMFARSALEVAEASLLLCRAPALVHHLVGRGHAVMSGMPRVDEVAQAFLEAIVLATDG